MIPLQRDQLIEALKAMTVEECDLDIDPSEIADETPLFGDGLALDSLDALQIAVAVKSSYGVRIESGTTGRQAMQNIASLADFIIEAAGKG